MIRAYNLKFLTNKSDSDPSNHLIVDLSETEAQRPQPIINDLDEDPIVDLEIDCDGISLWNIIDEIQLSCVEFDSDFDRLDREEESEMEEIDEALGDGFFRSCRGQRCYPRTIDSFIHTSTSALRGAFIATCDQGRSNRNLCKIFFISIHYCIIDYYSVYSFRALQLTQMDRAFSVIASVREVPMILKLFIKQQNCIYWRKT